MVKSIKITIGGKEYSLLGEDESQIHSAAEEFNVHYNSLARKYESESDQTLMILAGLNLADKYNKTRLQKDSDLSFLSNELEKMTAYLRHLI